MLHVLAVEMMMSFAWWQVAEKTVCPLEGLLNKEDNELLRQKHNEHLLVLLETHTKAAWRNYESW